MYLFSNDNMHEIYFEFHLIIFKTSGIILYKI